jgi:ubiquinone/menaquinone biosynthesis C-methylase UbiE
MSDITDPDFLLSEEYNDPSDLNTRISLQEQYSTNPYPWFRWLFDRLALAPHSRVLELGCGPGTLWLRNLDRFSETWQITLTDLAAGMIQHTRQKLRRSPLPFTFVVTNAANIPFAAETFDIVIIDGTLPHLPELDKSLADIRRVLRPGGTVYASTGGRSHLQELQELVQPFLPDVDYGGASSYFDLESGADQLAGHFSSVTLHSYDDDLLFTQSEPILAYILSEGEANEKLVGERRAELVELLEQELRARGGITVTVHKGLFEAQRPA